jgi:(p)ppGpp synthase/HD superfamily hydrolase
VPNSSACDFRVAPVLHDIPEDTDWTIEDLARGVDPMVCEVIDLLTR